jgi:hypothetical protein
MREWVGLRLASVEVEQSPPERCLQSFESSIFAMLRRLPTVPLSFYF